MLFVERGFETCQPLVLSSIYTSALRELRSLHCLGACRFFRFEVLPVAGYGGGSRFEVSGRRLKQQLYMDSFVDKYKKMTIGAEEEELDLNEADVKVVAHERRARPPPEPPPWSASKSRIWKKMDELYFNSI
ncbi:unnamed protein product [Cuscuta epithymum]|uniref:Uncharacterized protein n=1 Tax=Cuscuta epithymum TaxID=186058 RepID=A0AAV0FBY3_9ASTE|nr:unnamed protein product [Cuscuta epithymum]